MIPNENQHAQEPQLTALVFKRCQANSLHSLFKRYKEKVPGLQQPKAKVCSHITGTQATPITLILDSEIFPSRGWAATSNSARLGQPLREVEQAPGHPSGLKN